MLQADLNDKQAVGKEEIFDFIMSPNRDDSDLYLRYSALCLKNTISLKSHYLSVVIIK
jgi:hypothetical protein